MTDEKCEKGMNAIREESLLRTLNITLGMIAELDKRLYPLYITQMTSCAGEVKRIGQELEGTNPLGRAACNYVDNVVNKLLEYMKKSEGYRWDLQEAGDAIRGKCRAELDRMEQPRRQQHD